MSLMNLEVGQGIKFCETDETRNVVYNYGLIIKVDDKSIEFFKALPSFRSLGIDGNEYKVPCYKDNNAVYERHKDNVRLEGFLSVFTELGQGRKDGVYVHADMKDLKVYDIDDCKIHNVTCIDGGVKISKQAMHEILNHPWQEQKQKELTKKSLLKKDVADEQKKQINPSKRRLPDISFDMEENAERQFGE